MAEGLLRCLNVNVSEEGKCLDVAVLVHSTIAHVTLTDGLSLDATEVDGLGLRVVLDDLDDGESVDGQEMRVSTFPKGACSRRAVVQIMPMPASRDLWPVNT